MSRLEEIQALYDRAMPGPDSAHADMGWLLARVRELEAKLEPLYPLIRDLVDPDACWFDHHGGCQAHGYLSLQPGEICPHQEAKDWLRENAA